MSYKEAQSRLERLWDELGNTPAYRDTDDEEENDDQDTIQERESSDTRQEFDEYGEPAKVREPGNSGEEQENGVISGPFFIGKDKITEWMKHTPTRTFKTGKENIIKQLPGAERLAKSLTSP
ncbi:hypothetical protein HHI36_007130 [Cryptolaemus montrouzieri]|uniref:Uncharacterized protein n=1 Tax=Cryptolaemus montrouzieri TaxID=559131 RepID=A0ABD2MNP6_9CUCU